MLSVDEKMDALRRAPMFADEGDETLALLAQRVGEMSIEKGGVLFVEGEPGDTAYWIVSGTIDIVKGEDGEEGEVVLATLREGELFGEGAIFGAGTRTTSARAREDATLLFLKDKALKVLIQQAPDPT